jgi:hypothetical protein
MTNEKKKYGTHRRISDRNFERIKAVGHMGDSVNEVIGILLDNVEDIKRCVNGDAPQTEELGKLKFKWEREAIEEYMRMNSFNE